MVADDAALDVLALGGHVGFTALEVLVGPIGRRAPDGRDDDVALVEIRAVGVLDDRNGLVTEHHVVLALGEAAVRSADDLVVCPVDADPERPQQRRSSSGSGLGFSITAGPSEPRSTAIAFISCSKNVLCSELSLSGTVGFAGRTGRCRARIGRSPGLDRADCTSARSAV